MSSKGRLAVAALLAGLATAAPVTAGAAPRRIAILNAGEGAAAAATVRTALAAEKELAPLEPGDLSRALEQTLPAESPVDRALGEAADLLTAARTALAGFEHAQARRALSAAESVLLSVVPEPRVVELLADLQFQAGLVHLREQNRGLAIDAFRLVHGLAPSRPALDPARYPPEVVSALDAARKPLGAAATLRVTTAFDGAQVFVDGAPAGATPLDVSIGAGPHYLVVAADGRVPRGQRVDAAPRDAIALALELDETPVAQRAIELRHRVAAASGDRAALRAGAREAAELAGVDAVVVIAGDVGRAEASVYERGRDRLSVARPLGDGVHGLLGLLLPAPPPGPGDLLHSAQRQAAPTPWYQRPWAVASFTGGALLTIVAGVVLATGGGEPGNRSGIIGGLP